MIDSALADDRLRDAADVGVASYRGYLDLNLQANFAVGMNTRRNVNVDANFLILELGVDQRIDEARSGSGSHAHTGLEAPCGDRNLITDAQLGRLPIDGANFR